MSNERAVRTLRLPPADLNETKIPKTRQPARLWFRVHQTKLPAIYFSLNENHRFSHPKCPWPLLYLGSDAATCIFERFGDEMYDRKRAVAKSLWRAHSVSAIRVPELHVCDLTNPRTLSALMVDLSALTHHDLKTPQEWGLALQEHPANFEAIKFKSRFNHKVCLALFNRDGVETRLRKTFTERLSRSDTAADWLHDHKVSLY